MCGILLRQNYEKLISFAMLEESFPILEINFVINFFKKMGEVTSLKTTFLSVGNDALQFVITFLLAS